MLSAKSKILPLESLRGLAAIVVALYHCANGSVLTNNAFVQGGQLMVDFFFVLSGFVIALNYMDRIQDPTSLVAFQMRRFWRLYPLHSFTLLVFLGIECFKFTVHTYAHGDFGSPAFDSNNLVAFVNNLLLTQGVFFDRVSFNYPAWSISTEFYTYLLFALVMLTGRWRLALCAVIAFAGWGLLELFDPDWQQFDMRIFRCLYAFFLGVLGCAFMKRYNPVVPGVVPGLLLIASILSVPIFSTGCFHSGIPLLFLLTVCGFAGAGSDSLMVRALSLRPLVYLGTISYSLYMMHAMVWWFSNQALRAVFKVTSHYNQAHQAIMDLSPAAGVFATLIGIGVIIAVSRATYWHIEVRFQRAERPRLAFV